MRHYYRHYYRHRITGDYWTDLYPQASELWVVVGPRPFLDSARGMDEPYPGFSWAGDVDWALAQQYLEALPKPFPSEEPT